MNSERERESDWLTLTARRWTLFDRRVEEGERTLLGTTHANRAIHTHAASIMNTHIDAIGGLDLFYENMGNYPNTTIYRANRY